MDERTRNWTTLLYPDDLPNSLCDNQPYFFKLIESLKIPCCISPLHDPDVTNINPEEQRKKHYHLFLSFDNKKSAEQLNNMFLQLFGSQSGWIKFDFSYSQVSSPKALTRYFIHLDQPSKQQFDLKWQALTLFNGFQVEDYFQPSSSERMFFLSEMKKWCLDFDCLEISDLQTEALFNHYDTWNWILDTNGLYVMKSFLDSRRNKRKYCKEVDLETGEIKE